MNLDARRRQAINRTNAARQGPHSFWTVERTATLREKAALNLTARSIAAAIGARCTRNMVIGKAKREGIALAPAHIHAPETLAEQGKRKAELRHERNARQISILRGRCAKILEQIIVLSLENESRVSRETSAPPS